MADATPNRLGQINATGTTTDGFLEVFSGMVLEAFDRKQQTMDRHMVRTISSGFSAQFPVIWKADAVAHTPGAELNGSIIRHGEKTIPIEFLLVSDVFIANIDEAMLHYDVRAPYAHQLGQALANAADANVFRSIFEGSGIAANAVLTGHLGGSKIFDPAIHTSAAILKAAIFDAAEDLDDRDVPSDDRYLAVRPAQFYLLLQDGEFINRDYSGEGSKARANLPWASDLQVLKSNNIPSANDTANTNIPTTLRQTYAPYIAAVWHKSGVATVKLLDLKVESEYQIQRQGTLIVAKYAMGHDYIRPEACITLTTS
jgi:hypothetical protein